MTCSLPHTYRKAVFHGVDSKPELIEVPMVHPGAREALVKVEACGICWSDTMVQRASSPTNPRTPGHEIVGRIVALGPLPGQWTIGTRVGSGWHGGHDGTCSACRRGWYQMCDTKEINGLSRDGGFGEYVVLSIDALAAVPDINPATGESYPAAKIAPQLCAGLTVFNAIRNQRLMPGSTVAVHGLGGLGHLAVQFCRRMGYRTIAISRGGTKRNFAMQLGAHDFVDSTVVRRARVASISNVSGSKEIPGVAAGSGTDNDKPSLDRTSSVDSVPTDDHAHHPLNHDHDSHPENHANVLVDGTTSAHGVRSSVDKAVDTAATASGVNTVATTAVGESLRALGRVDLVVVTTPTLTEASGLLRGLGVRGTVLYLALPGPITVDTLGMFHKGLKLEVWPVGHALDCEETIEFARLFDVHCMVETFPLDQVQEAYERMLHSKVRFRAVLTM